MNEEWRTIEAFPDYEVSSFGVVRRRRSVRGSAKGRVLTPHKDRDGYLCVYLVGGAARMTRRRIHRLVLDAFVGPRPSGMVCAHADCNPANNRLDNLRWTTQRDNLQDSISRGRNPHGAKHGCATIDESIAAHIKATFTGKHGEQTRIARDIGVSLTIVNNILRGRAWRHVGAARN